MACGAAVQLVLAMPPDEFKPTVALPGTDWATRFRALLVRAQVDVVEAAEGGEIFEMTNERIVEMARALDPDPHAVVVWDGRRGDGPGGTQDFLAQLNEACVHVIDPRPER